jgi:hypothetical protein
MAACGFPSPPLEERARERRPYLLKLLQPKASSTD